MTTETLFAQEALSLHDFTGPRSASTGSVPENTLQYCRDATLHSDWRDAYVELARTAFYGAGATLTGMTICNTALASVEFQSQALPIAPNVGPSEVLTSLEAIERVFGNSASNLARILCVSRPMIYHYRKGMAPDHENFRRIRLIASLAGEITVGAHTSLEPELKTRQPEGQTLLAYLSEKTPNLPLVRRILLRVSSDLDKRRRLAESLGYATAHDRQDIMRERHARGKPIYVSDPDVPGKIVQIRPDQSRVRGRLVNRVFVADEE